jgi:pectate disaccharide-lyase
VETMYGPVTVVAYFQGTITQYQLTTSVSPSGGGTLTFSPSCCTYNAGTQVTITATQAGNYQFSGWTGVDSSSGATGYVTMNANRSVTANFVPTTTYTLTTTVSPSGGGTLTFSPSCCTYNAGTQVTITATQASNYQFSGWTGVDSSSGATGYVTMNANKSVTANFASIGSGPTITAFSPTAAPVGTTVTIQGANFGSTGTVTFGQTSAAIVSWASGSIVATVPGGLAAGSLTVTVTAGGQNGTGSFTVSPGITTLSPNPVTPGSQVTITGTSFGAAQGTVSFNGTAATVSTWTDSSITATVPAGTVSGSVVVTANSVASSPAAFTVTTPQNYTISGTVTIGSCPLAGVTVGLTGFPNTTTNASGAYNFSSVPGAANYQITLQLTNYTFPTAPYPITNLSATQQINFAANGPAIPSREYIRLGGRMIAISNCRSQ